ncbi:hypothetical protein CWI75_02920 [Kineobactrum sediminis]|uniref:Uncharacterized protein n=1 Tax=Kineobactrum sediminis TaxID=1905677 RepID=A0A2N5Y7D9_9GAMM|nr:hypothetical protein CWI75_02920 [Kineobactrum sediminis]
MKIKRLSKILFAFVFAVVSTLEVAAEDEHPRGLWSPTACRDNILVAVRPIYPRHTVHPDSGCRISVDVKVMPSGKVQVPHYPNDVNDEGLRTVAQIEPEECSNRYISSVLHSLQKAQFAESHDGFSCKYTYHWLLEP